MAALLLPYGIVPSPALALPAPRRTAVIRRERYVVTLPPCPDWSKPAAGAGDFTNTASSNFGCANAVNLGLMVAKPADLAEAAPLGPAAGQPAAAAVQRYLNDKVQSCRRRPRIGPIAAPISRHRRPPAAAGAGAAGDQP